LTRDASQSDALKTRWRVASKWHDVEQQIA